MRQAMRLVKTKQTRKRSGRKSRQRSRRSTPPFSPLLGVLGGADLSGAPAAEETVPLPRNMFGHNNTFEDDTVPEAPKAEVDLSGAPVNVEAAEVDLSGAPVNVEAAEVDLSGAPVNVEAEVDLSGAPVTVEAEVDLSGAPVTVDAAEADVKEVDLSGTQSAEEKANIIAQPARPDLKGLKSEYSKQLTDIINAANVATINKLIKCIVYSVQNKKFTKPIKEYEEMLTPESIQKGIESGTLQEAQQVIASALWKKLILTLAE